MKGLRSLGIEYDDCPLICEKADKSVEKIDPLRVDVCERCPTKAKKTEFRRRTERLWLEWLKEKSDLLDFDKTMSLFYAVLTAKRIPRSSRLIKMNAFVQIYESEKSRADRLERALIAKS